MNFSGGGHRAAVFSLSVGDAFLDPVPDGTDPASAVSLPGKAFVSSREVAAPLGVGSALSSVPARHRRNRPAQARVTARQLASRTEYTAYDLRFAEAAS